MSRRTVAFLKCDYCGRERQEHDDVFARFRGVPSDYYCPRRPDLPISVTFVSRAEYDEDAKETWSHGDGLTHGEHKGEFCSRGCAMAWLADNTHSIEAWPQPQGDGE